MKISRNFNLREFDCKDGTRVPKEFEGNVVVLAWQLQALRTYVGKPVKVLSGYRSKSHNKKVKGAKGSKHLTGEAADIRIDGLKPGEVKEVIDYLISIGGMLDGGIGVYPNFLHYDIGRVRRW